MRLSMWSLILACVAFTASAQNQKVLTPTKDGVAIWANEVRAVYEQPLFTVSTSDRLAILETKKSSYKVSVNGQVGWIEKNLTTVAGKSKSFVFESAEVIGYLDNPTPVYIIDMDDPNADPISLDRSFKDALKENVDKETVERLAR